MRKKKAKKKNKKINDFKETEKETESHNLSLTQNQLETLDCALEFLIGTWDRGKEDPDYKRLDLIKDKIGNLLESLI